MEIEMNCPSCGAAFTGVPGERQLCATCGESFVPGEGADALRAGPHELEIQNAPGDAIRGPFDRLDIRERLYRGLLTGEELVRPVGGRFRELRSIPDFAAVMEIKTRGIPRPVVSRRPAPGHAPVAGPAGASSGEAGSVPTDLDVQPPAPSGRLPISSTEKRRMMSVAVVTLALGSGLLLVAYFASSMLM